MSGERILSICVAAALFFGPLIIVAPCSDGLEMRMVRNLKDAHVAFSGVDASDRVGECVAIAGDVNGDGYDDILIGAGYDDNGATVDCGRVYLIFGKPYGWYQDTSLLFTDASFVGEHAGDRAGMSVAGAGDVNGDGYDDILIGAYGNDDSATNAGQVYLILGKSSGWAMGTSLANADASFWGEETDDCAGACVAGAGDVNADGYADILIGAYGNNDGGGANAGQTYLILGGGSGWAMDTKLSSLISGSAASYWGDNAGDKAGVSLAGVGDINGDGYDDFVIGAPLHDFGGGTDNGMIYVMYGHASNWNMDRDLGVDFDAAIYWTSFSNIQFGSPVAAIGDINGDGFADIGIGWPEYSSGEMSILYGQSSKFSGTSQLVLHSYAGLTGAGLGNHFGYSIAGTGDLDGDGLNDVVVGAVENGLSGASAGQVYICGVNTFSRSANNQIASFLGEGASDNAGYSVASGGDVNGDGTQDILISAWGWDSSTDANVGKVYLIMPNCLPPPPLNLRAHLPATQRHINLTWSAPSGWNEHIVGYRIYKANGSDFKYIATNDPTDRTYTDNNVAYGVTYRYYVQTVDASGRLSDKTCEVSVVCDRDTDQDSIGDLADWDIDGDGVPNGQDAFPLDKTESLDTDRDGIGNNADTDDDNDGIPDISDPEPLNPQNALQYHLNYLNTTLQNVQTNVNNAGTALSTLNTNLNALTGNVNSMNSGLTNLINGVNANVNTVNNGLTNQISGVNSNLDTMNTQVRGDIASLSTAVQTDIALLNSNMTGQLSGLNATLRGDITKLSTDFLTKLEGVNVSLTANLDGVRTMLGDVSSSLDAVDARLMSMNESLSSDIAEMESTLKTDIMALGLALAIVNDSLNNELGGISQDMTDFRTEMIDTLASNMEKLDRTNETQNANYRKLENLMNNINSSSLADIKGQLVAMAADNAAMEQGLLGSVDGLKNSTMTHFDNISRMMATVDHINSLTTEVKLAQGQIKEVQTEQKSTSDKVAGLTTPAWGSMVLIIIVLLVAVIILLASRKAGGAPPESQTYPSPQAEPGPKTRSIPPPEDQAMTTTKKNLSDKSDAGEVIPKDT